MKTDHRPEWAKRILDYAAKKSCHTELHLVGYTLVETPSSEFISSKIGEMYVFKEDLISEKLRDFGAHQESSVRLATRFLRPGDVVIDVGAYIGTFSIPLAKSIGPKGKLYAFEPILDHFQILRRNIELASLGTRVKTFHRLASNDNETYSHIYSKSNRGGTAFHRCAEHSMFRAIRLDDWMKEFGKIDFIKLDVEGMERRVLEGSRQILTEFKPTLLVEVSELAIAFQKAKLTDLEDLLREFGYHFFINLRGKPNRFALGKISKLSHGGSQYDVLAIHPSSQRYPKRYFPALLSRSILIKRRFLNYSNKTR